MCVGKCTPVCALIEDCGGGYFKNKVMLSKNTIFIIISYGWILFKDNKVDTRIPHKGCIHTTSTLTEINIIFKPNKCSELAWNQTMGLRTTQELSLGNLLSIRVLFLLESYLWYCCVTKYTPQNCHGFGHNHLI